MLHEAKDRQKFVSDVQYLRDMQHKAGPEYQVMAGSGSIFYFHLRYSERTQATVSVYDKQ